MAEIFLPRGRKSLLSDVQQRTMDGYVHAPPRAHIYKEEQEKF